METVTYKGYLVEAAPEKLEDSGKWRVHVYITCAGGTTGDFIKDRSHYDIATFETEEEAIPHCLDLGKRIIDGKAQGCGTVRD